RDLAGLGAGRDQAGRPHAPRRGSESDPELDARGFLVERERGLWPGRHGGRDHPRPPAFARAARALRSRRLHLAVAALFSRFAAALAAGLCFAPPPFARLALLRTPAAHAGRGGMDLRLRRRPPAPRPRPGRCPHSKPFSARTGAVVAVVAVTETRKVRYGLRIAGPASTPAWRGGLRRRRRSLPPRH